MVFPSSITAGFIGLTCRPFLKNRTLLIHPEDHLLKPLSFLFDTILEKQLILKGIVDPQEWAEIKNYIRYDFMKDNYFEELKQTEILREKVSTLRDIEEHVGTYYSREWVAKNVLFMNDDDMKEIQKQIEQEKAGGLYGNEDDMDDQEEQDVVQMDVDDKSSNTEIDAEESLKVINKTKSLKRGIKP